MRNIHVEIDYIDSPSNSTRIFSIYPDTTSEGRLIGELIFSASVRTWVQKDRSQSSLSRITLANADGSLDAFVDETHLDCRIKEVIDGTSTTLATGKVDRVTFDGERNIIIELKDAKKLLDVQLQGNEFPASETSLSDGVTTNTYYALENVQRPICLGYCVSIPPVLGNRSINEYFVHDDQFFDIVDVYDNGVSVTHNDYVSSFTLNADPAGRIVADVKGEENSGGTDFLETPREIVDYIFSKISFTDYSTDDLDDLEPKDSADGVTTYTPLLCYYQTNDTALNVNEILQWMCDSWEGWYYVDALGDIRFGYLKEPDNYTADHEITENEIIDKIHVFDDLAPNLTKKVGSQRNWFVYNQDDIAAGATAQNKIDLSQKFRKISESTQSIDSFYTVNSTTHDSLLRNGARADEESDNIAYLYSVRRKFYTFDCKTNIGIGEIANLTFNRFGLESGKKLQCVGYSIDFMKVNNYRVTLWG